MSCTLSLMNEEQGNFRNAFEQPTTCFDQNVLFLQALYQKHIPGIPDHYKVVSLVMIK